MLCEGQGNRWGYGGNQGGEHVYSFTNVSPSLGGELPLSDKACVMNARIFCRSSSVVSHLASSHANRKWGWGKDCSCSWCHSTDLCSEHWGSPSSDSDPVGVWLNRTESTSDTSCYKNPSTLGKILICKRKGENFLFCKHLAIRWEHRARTQHHF